MNDTALLLCDLQNDFLSPGGAYARANQAARRSLSCPPGWHPSCRPSVLPAVGLSPPTLPWFPMRGGEPYISAHLRHVRPFLQRGDFLPGSWGHALVDELGPADIAVEKVAFSAFYQSRLEWALARADVRKLLIAGIVTNGGVATTTRDAHVRDFDVTLLQDGCAAFDVATHETAVAALRPVAQVMTVAESLAAIR